MPWVTLLQRPAQRLAARRVDGYQVTASACSSKQPSTGWTSCASCGSSGEAASNNNTPIYNISVPWFWGKEININLSTSYLQENHFFPSTKRTNTLNIKKRQLQLCTHSQLKVMHSRIKLQQKLGCPIRCSNSFYLTTQPQYKHCEHGVPSSVSWCLQDRK